MTQGIKRVEELFEVRNPKKPAIIIPFDGTIEIYESAKKIEVEITSEPLPKTYIVKEGYTVDVKKGDELTRGAGYASKGKSTLKTKEEGVIMEVHDDYIVLGELQKIKKKLAVGTSLKIKNGAQVFK